MYTRFQGWQDEVEDAAVAVGAAAWIGGFFLAVGIVLNHLVAF